MSSTWFEKWMRALTQPSVATFEDLANDPDARDSLIAYFWVIVTALIIAVINFLLGANIISLITVTIVSVVVFAVVTSIINFIAIKLGGQGRYSELTFAFAAFIAPLSLIRGIFSLTPCGEILSLFLTFYSLVLGVIAVKAVHRLSWGKAMIPSLSVFTSVVVVIIVFLLLVGPIIGDVSNNIVRENSPGLRSSLPSECPPDCVEADLQGVNLSKVGLRGANLSKANLSEANLVNGTLGSANLSFANLSKANLRGADLSEADLHETILTQANLSGANLRNANLSGADLHKANLIGAFLHGVVFQGVKLGGVDLSRADLSGVDLSGVDLRGTDLSEADLNEANLSGANLGGTNLSRANLNGVDLSGANNLLDANLQGAKYNDATKWPVNFDPQQAGAISVH